jgi:hypothetical protein
MSEYDEPLEDSEKAKPIKLSDDDIMIAIQDEETGSYGYLSGELADQRAQALDYYYGEDYGNEVDGRSKVKTSELSDVIESILPSLMKVFAGGEQVVKFSPRNAEDVQQAEQESDYLNWLVLEKNQGFNVLYTWFKDALIQKNGYVIATWEESEKATEEVYEGLRDEEMAFLLQDPEIEVLEYTPREVQDIDGMVTVHDVKINKVDEDGELKIYNIPPEEMLVSIDCPTPNPKDSNFVQWRTVRTISEVRELGYDVDDEIADDDDYLLDLESNARNQFDEMSADMEGVDKATRRVVFKRTWIRMDANGDGIAELLFICHIGKTILHKEVVDTIPVSCLTPIPVPHRHIGRSYADLIMDLQLQKSTMLRQIFDNMYLANNARTGINATNVNLDDLLTSTAGGVVRVNGSPHENIMPIIAPQVAGAGFQMLEYIDTLVEVKTGVTKYNQGMDANSLNKTASGISQIMSAAQQRVELVSRVFAETGIKDLFQTVHGIVSKHAKKADIVQLRNQWIPIDPRQWTKRTDMVVTVGLGTGNKDQQLSHIMNILTVMKEAMAGGVPIVTPENLYNAVIELTKNAGFKDADKFWTNPKDIPPKEPQPDPEMIKVQGQMQLEQMKSQTTMQTEKFKQEMQAQQVQQQNQIQAQADMQKAQIQAELDAQKLEFERWKTELVESNKIVLAQLSADTSIKQSSMSINASKSEGLTDMDEEGNEKPTNALSGLVEAMNNNVIQLMQVQDAKHAQLAELLTKPKTIIRDANGRVAGVQ